ncbi:MAG: exosome complex RNA-binding protein Csl4 [Candidatus Micrarchaeota archaeon]
MNKKLVLPGDYLSSAEEAEPGENTYTEKDEVYSAAIGEDESSPGHALVKTKGRSLKKPAVGDIIYCLIIKATPNKAIGTCMSADEVNGNGRGLSFDAVLPVTAIKREYVREIRDEVRIGDILKAKIQKITKSGIDISVIDHDCGVICAFCPRCRQNMKLKEKVFICGGCGWKDYKKIPLAEGETPPTRERFERYESGDRGQSSYGNNRREYGRRPQQRNDNRGSYGRKTFG